MRWNVLLMAKKIISKKFRDEKFQIFAKWTTVLAIKVIFKYWVLDIKMWPGMSQEIHLW